MSDRRRRGDDRPTKHDPALKLRLRPVDDEPFRWLPRHGQPSCIGEWMSQRFVTAVAWAPLYTAIVVTLTLVVLVVTR